MPPGKVSLVGVGPGDPELLTRKAERVLRDCDVLYHPGRSERTGFAIGVVAGLIRGGTEIRGAAVEMQDPGDRYERLAAELAAETRAGRHAVFITEGDPLLYSTASHLLAALQRGWPDVAVDVVPGVSSLTAAAAAARQSLARSRETLGVIPACHYPDQLEELIANHDRVVLVKIGSVFREIVACAERRGWLERAVYVEKVGTPDERIVRDIRSVDPASVSYFSLVLIDTRVARGADARTCGDALR